MVPTQLSRTPTVLIPARVTTPNSAIARGATNQPQRTNLVDRPRHIAGGVHEHRNTRRLDERTNPDSGYHAPETQLKRHVERAPEHHRELILHQARSQTATFNLYYAR